MRWLAIISVFALAACGERGKGGGPTDGGTSATCAPSGGCPLGPTCGSTCCNTGERCVNGTCLCGAAAACTNNNTCERSGPVGTDQCGTLCCGGTGPCPQ